MNDAVKKGSKGRAADSLPAGKNVLLCLTGGIACYKSATLASRLVQAGAAVSVAMTAGAEKFITPLTFQTLTGRRVYTSLWQASEDFDSQHLSLTGSADLMIIAPATADIMAKMASGLADDLVSTLALSAHGACPILIAPAMNTRMWLAPPTQDNLARLKGWGIHVIGPEQGRLACDTTGPGRMSEPEEILAAAMRILQGGKGKRGEMV
jgi:phosphopantothenoylcysteine decarboxylase/phosphopantothenate--cysteine ligase